MNTTDSTISNISNSNNELKSSEIPIINPNTENYTTVDNNKTYSTISSMKKLISKNIIIVILATLLIISFLGIYIFKNIAIELKNIVFRILSLFGFYTGAIINTTADIVGDTTKGGIDIAEGTVHSIGNLLQNEDNMDGNPSNDMKQWNLSIFNLNPTSKPSIETSKNNTWNWSTIFNMNSEKPTADKNPSPVSSISPEKEKSLDLDINRGIKRVSNYIPIDSEQNKTSWCPVGFVKGVGKCIKTTNKDKCMFGKVFDTQQECEKDISGISFKGSIQERSVNWGIPPLPPPPAALTPPYIPQMFNELPGQTCGGNKHYTSFGRYGEPIMYKQSILTNPPSTRCNSSNSLNPKQLLPPPNREVIMEKQKVFDNNSGTGLNPNMNDYNNNYPNQLTPLNSSPIANSGNNGVNNSSDYTGSTGLYDNSNNSNLPINSNDNTYDNTYDNLPNNSPINSNDNNTNTYDNLPNNSTINSNDNTYDLSDNFNNNSPGSSKDNGMYINEKTMSQHVIVSQSITDSQPNLNLQKNNSYNMIISPSESVISKNSYHMVIS